MDHVVSFIMMLTPKLEAVKNNSKNFAKCRGYDVVTHWNNIRRSERLDG